MVWADGFPRQLSNEFEVTMKLEGPLDKTRKPRCKATHLLESRRVSIMREDVCVFVRPNCLRRLGFFKLVKNPQVVGSERVESVI